MPAPSIQGMTSSPTPEPPTIMLSYHPQHSLGISLHSLPSSGNMFSTLSKPTPITAVFTVPPPPHHHNGPSSSLLPPASRSSQRAHQPTPCLSPRWQALFWLSCLLNHTFLNSVRKKSLHSAGFSFLFNPLQTLQIHIPHLGATFQWLSLPHQVASSRSSQLPPAVFQAPHPQQRTCWDA